MNTEIQEITKEYIKQQVKEVNDAANLTLESIYDRSKEDGLSFIFDAKFNKIGYNPLKTNVEDNLMEQINQSITLLTTYWILDQHIGKYFRANLGEKNGTDLEIFDTNKEDSIRGIFEIFAATDPYQNKKLLKDIRTVVNRADGASTKVQRSVCFCSPWPFRTSVKKYHGMQINWKEKIISPEEKKKYSCNVQGKSIDIIWIKNGTLLSWAANLQ